MSYLETLLHRAVWSGRVDVARLPLERGADDAAVNVARYTPLHAATSHEYADVVRLSLYRGVDVGARNRQEHSLSRVLLIGVKRWQGGYCLTAAWMPGSCKVSEDLLEMLGFRGVGGVCEDKSRPLVCAHHSDSFFVGGLLIRVHMSEDLVARPEDVRRSAAAAWMGLQGACGEYLTRQLRDRLLIEDRRECRDADLCTSVVL